MDMDTFRGPDSPVAVEGAERPDVSRALWLVKWLLAIPHFIVLAFLAAWAVFAWFWALFAILITGRYPRLAFDYLVGVMRWGWRLSYYLYNVGGTDRYPPFTIADVPDYPARLDVRYPERLSRGLVLVKWWLLAIPHYIILAVLFGFTRPHNNETGQVTTDFNWPGLVPILVLIALIMVLVSGTYPQQVYRVAMGFNRWQLRVAAYSLLMTDEYPPFRLDQGPYEPGGPRLMPLPTTWDDAWPTDDATPPPTPWTPPPPPPSTPQPTPPPAPPQATPASPTPQQPIPPEQTPPASPTREQPPSTPPPPV